MANKKISEMAAVSSLLGTELIPIVQSGDNKSVTPTLIKQFVYASSVNVWGYVDVYADLPLGTTASDPEIGDMVGVNTTTGVWLIGTQRRAGFYKRVALSGVVATDYGTTPFSGFPLQADQATVDAGTDDTLYVTPDTLANTTLLSAKVDKVTGKGLSTNDYTTAEQSKLSGIEASAVSLSTVINSDEVEFSLINSFRQ